MHNLREVLPELQEDEQTMVSARVFNASHSMVYFERLTKFLAAKGVTA